LAALRRDQLTHPPYQKPELPATAPNQLWSWDITKLLGPAKWTYFYLYVILDVFSRYITGWMVAMRESAELAKRLIEQRCAKQNIRPGQLTLHADRGTSMSSKPVALLLADLGVTKTHSRPHISDDNPYSESQFRTMEYRPEFPGRFGCIQDSRAFSQGFVRWYNEEHRHSGLGLLTPAMVHHHQTTRSHHDENAVYRRKKNERRRNRAMELKLLQQSVRKILALNPTPAACDAVLLHQHHCGRHSEAETAQSQHHRP
jgi:putative transposase